MDQAQITTPLLVAATFEDQERAGAAVRALQERGITDEHISAVVRHDDPEVTAGQMVELDREADETGADVAIGGAAGGLAGFLTGLALFSIPGLGPFLGLGVLATTLGGAAVGSAVGERAAHLTSLGVSEEHAERLHSALHQGYVLLAVVAHDTQTATTAQEVLQAAGADDIDVHPYQPGANDSALPDPTDQTL